MTAAIGILGGTFDPPHFGHLRPALELCEQLALAQMRFIPASVPPHRSQPLASASQRSAMLQLAIVDEARFVCDTRELERPGPSFTVDTLYSLREEFPDTPLCLCIGMDAFLQLHTWHQWERLGELAHVIVSHRPGWTPSPQTMAVELANWLAPRLIEDPQHLQTQAAGWVMMQQPTQLSISASAIREQIGVGKSPRYLLPEAVWRYIEQHQLYHK